MYLFRYDQFYIFPGILYNMRLAQYFVHTKLKAYTIIFPNRGNLAGLLIEIINKCQCLCPWIAYELWGLSGYFLVKAIEKTDTGLFGILLYEMILSLVIAILKPSVLHICMCIVLL